MSCLRRHIFRLPCKIDHSAVECGGAARIAFFGSFGSLELKFKFRVDFAQENPILSRSALTTSCFIISICLLSFRFQGNLVKLQPLVEATLSQVLGVVLKW